MTIHDKLAARLRSTPHEQKEEGVKRHSTLTPEEQAARDAKAALPRAFHLYVTRAHNAIRNADGSLSDAYELQGVWTPETRSMSTGLWRSELEAWESYRLALELQEIRQNQKDAGLYSEPAVIEIARFVRERNAKCSVRVSASPSGGYVVNIGGGRSVRHVRAHGKDLETACDAARRAMECE